MKNEGVWFMAVSAWILVTLGAAMRVSPAEVNAEEPAQQDVYARYLHGDLSYFRRNAFEDPLFYGLQALVLGEEERAVRWLLEALARVPGRLKPSVYRDLAALNYDRRRWARGIYFDLLADPGTGIRANPRQHFPKYPPEEIAATDSIVTVDIDGFYVNGCINGSGESIGNGGGPQKLHWEAVFYC